VVFCCCCLFVWVFFFFFIICIFANLASNIARSHSSSNSRNSICSYTSLTQHWAVKFKMLFCPHFLFVVYI
jgi:hypothetical protein